jgi:hypothetical protein
MAMQNVALVQSRSAAAGLGAAPPPVTDSGADHAVPSYRKAFPSVLSAVQKVGVGHDTVRTG